MALGKSIRKDFPIFKKKVNGQRLAYLDSAATSQKPKSVLSAEREYYETMNGNPGRGVSTLTAEAGEAYEKARMSVAEFIGAKAEEIVFTRNTTESLNLLSYCLPSLLDADHARPVALSAMEHHSNLVPWQQMAMRTGRELAFIPFETNQSMGAESLESFQPAAKPAMLTLSQASNALGTLNEVEGMVRHAREHWGGPVVVDAAQSAPHIPIDVKKMDCDFLAFSGHKMLGPMGIGVLYMKGEWMERLPPFLTGGGQIGRVEDTRSTWAEGPAKFEAGTPNVPGAVGLAAAMDYLQKAGMSEILEHEQKLVKKTLDALESMEGVTLYGLPSASGRVGVVSFNVEGVHAHDVGSILDRHGVQVRVGHHCAQPLMRKLGVSATVRASFYLYNDRDDVVALEEGLDDVKKIFEG
ncbi:Cysteine desulfurase [uncultured archaeon]|nr:Cysteine desulfurase [uncultured archaeon]